MAKIVTQSTENMKEVSSQLNAVMVTPIGISRAMAKINKKLTPILRKLLTCTKGHKHEMAFKDLVDWLIHPRRIVEQFIYVLGPLVHHVNMKYVRCGLDYREYMIYIGLAALEVISVKCPVLDGQWEISVWLIMKIIYYFNLETTPIPRVSNQLSSWLIHVIGDADVCPNAHLRIELIKVLKMVKIGAHNRLKAFNAVMDACSYLSFDDLARDSGCKNCFPNDACCPNYDWLNFDTYSEMENSPIIKYKYRNYNGCSHICLGTIVTIFNHLIEDYITADFSKRLVDKLNDVNSARLSSIVHDFTYGCGVNPNKYTEPLEIQSLIALLNITGRIAHHENKKVERQKSEYIFDRTKKTVMDMFKILMNNFKECYKLPQITNSIALFIIDIMEFVITSDFYRHTEEVYDWDEYMKELDATYIIKFEFVLQELLRGSSSDTIDNSPIGQELLSRYGSRLKRLKDLYGDFDNFPTIHSLITHV